MQEGKDNNMKTTKNLKDKAFTYRLPMTTTPETLGMHWSKTLTFGNKLLLAGFYYNGKHENNYFGAVYEFATADHTCEGEIKLTAISDEFMEDDGHAMAWAMTH